MIRRIGIVALVVVSLIGLIVYSQLRPVPDRVSGFIEADEIRVGSRLGGRVLKVHVVEGERVEQGRLLVELEPFDLLQREQEAAKSLAAIEADVQRLTKGLRPGEIAQAKARYEQFKARYDLLVAGPRKQEIEAAQSRVQLAESEQILAQQFGPPREHRQHRLFTLASEDPAHGPERGLQTLLDQRGTQS